MQHKVPQHAPWQLWVLLKGRSIHSLPRLAPRPRLGGPPRRLLKSRSLSRFSLLSSLGSACPLSFCPETPFFFPTISQECWSFAEGKKVNHNLIDARCKYTHIETCYREYSNGLQKNGFQPNFFFFRRVYQPTHSTASSFKESLLTADWHAVWGNRRWFILFLQRSTKPLK